MPSGKNKRDFTIKKLILGEMAVNCYLAFDEKSREAIVIDPGDEADYIEKVINDLKLTPALIVATHGHFDHILAATELKLAYNIPFYMSKEDVFLLKKVKNYSAIPPKIDKNLIGSDEIKLGGLKIKALAVPGHTPGSIALLCGKHAFVGDTVFANGSIGRFDFPYSDKEKLFKSVHSLKKLPKGTIIHPGHGEEFTVDDFGT